MNATYEAYVASDLYQAGIACDGHPFIAEKYYVLIENAAGRRFRHEKSFAGAEVVKCEETGETGFADIRETAKTIKPSSSSIPFKYSAKVKASSSPMPVRLSTALTQY